MSRGGLALGALLAAGTTLGGGCGGDPASTATSVVASPHAGYRCGVVWDVQWRLGPRLRGATPDALDLGRYPLSAEGAFLSPAGTTCTDAIAAALTALCDPCEADPGGCEPRVRAVFRDVPASCGRCGDGVCHGDETAASCAPDCGTTCGDGACSALESPLACPMDCGEPCGDGRCAGGEDAASCPIDCRYAVGDGLCEPGETPANSPEDCGFATCGDGACQSYETALRCPEDCCWPRACDAAMRPRCRGTGGLEACEPRGLGGCPELVATETCDLGCIDAADGARCATCADRVARAFAGQRAPCDPSEAAWCSNPTLFTCEPLPGAPTCGALLLTRCPNGCADGACAPEVP